jgi:hypothetical protein
MGACLAHFIRLQTIIQLSVFLLRSEKYAIFTSLFKILMEDILRHTSPLCTNVFQLPREAFVVYIHAGSESLLRWASNTTVHVLYLSNVSEERKGLELVVFLNEKNMELGRPELQSLFCAYKLIWLEASHLNFLIVLICTNETRATFLASHWN